MRDLEQFWEEKCLKLQQIHKELDKCKELEVERMEDIKNELYNLIKMGIGKVTSNSVDVIAAITNIQLTQEEKIFLFDLFKKCPEFNTQAIEQVASSLDEEIAKIENMFQKKLMDLENSREEIIEITAFTKEYKLVLETLQLKIYEQQEKYASEMDGLLKEQQQVTNDTEISEVEQLYQLEVLTKRIEEKEADYQLDIKALKEQMEQCEKEIESKLNEVEKILQTYNNTKFFKIDITIKSEHEGAVDLKNEIKSLEKQLNKIEGGTSSRVNIHNLNAKRQEIMLNLKKLKHQEALQNIERILHKKGLRITASSMFVNANDNLLSENEARDLGLLEGIPSDLVAELFQMRAAKSSHRSTSTSGSTQSLIESEDVDYLKKTIGKALTLGLAEVTKKQPRDPIHYLAHWLIKYRYNQELDLVQSKEVEELTAERTRIAQEALKKLIEEEARKAILDLIVKVEHIVLEKEIAAANLQMLEEEEQEEEQEQNESTVKVTDL